MVPNSDKWTEWKSVERRVHLLSYVYSCCVTGERSAYGVSFLPIPFSHVSLCVLKHCVVLSSFSSEQAASQGGIQDQTV